MDSFNNEDVSALVALCGVCNALGRDNVRLSEIDPRKKTNGSVRF